MRTLVKRDKRESLNLCEALAKQTKTASTLNILAYLQLEKLGSGVRCKPKEQQMFMQTPD